MEKYLFGLGGFQKYAHRLLQTCLGPHLLTLTFVEEEIKTRGCSGLEKTPGLLTSVF